MGDVSRGKKTVAATVAATGGATGAANEKRRFERFVASTLKAFVGEDEIEVLDISLGGLKLGPIPRVTLGDLEIKLVSVDAEGREQATMVLGNVVRIDLKCVTVGLNEADASLANFVIREAAARFGVKPFLFKG